MTGPKRRAAPSSYPPALLTYKVVPNAVAYSESGEAPSIVTFVITVSNPSAQEVPCSLIAFHFRAGSEDGALVSDPDSIDAGSTTGVRWSITRETGGDFTALPEPPDTGIAAGGAISFKFSKARINSTAGTGTIDVYEDSGGVTRATSLPVIKQRPGLSITEFMADPVQVAPGENTVLRWATTGAQGVTLTWAGNELKLGPNGHHPVKIENTTTFTLGAEGKGDPVYQQVTATVAKPTILYFQAEPDIIAVGGASNLKWKSQNANRGLIKPGDIQVDPSSGQWPVAPKERQQYELTVWRDGASYNDSRTTTLEVKRVVVERFVGLPETIPLLGKAKLEWSTRWADKVEIQPDIGDVPVKGECDVSPQCDTVYEITAHGPEGPVRQSVTVRVDIGANLPLGTILAYAGRAPDALEAAGWLVCKGQALKTQHYRCLHKAIGNNFGAPRAGEFCLPDMERNFLRGVDAGAGRDPDARFRTTSRSGGTSGDAVGSRQDYGTAPARNKFRVEYGKLNITPSRNDNGCGTRPAEYNYNVTQKSEAASGGDEETRPKNLAVFFIIKARMVTDAGVLVVPPVGAVLSYAGNATQPAGEWLLCNGTAKERGEFAALFGCIGTIYGETGPSNFKLPDYRGMFLRGIDGTSTRAVGNFQDWATALPQAATTGGISPLKTDFGHLPTSDASKQVNGALYDLARLNTGATDVALSGTNGGDNESRPCNLSVDFHVRAGAGAAEDVPVGTVIACGTQSLPGSNFRLCDGTLLQKAENEALFAAIGTLYGGDASRGEFRIPDYRGLFLRGANRDSSNDPDAPLRRPKGTGTPQEPGSFQDWATGRPRNAFKGKVTYLPNSTIGSHGATASNRAGVDGNKTIDTCTEGGNAETRPRNVAVAFFIKLHG